MEKSLPNSNHDWNVVVWWSTTQVSAVPNPPWFLNTLRLDCLTPQSHKGVCDWSGSLWIGKLPRTTDVEPTNPCEPPVKFASTTKYTRCSFMPVFQICLGCAMSLLITKQWSITMMTTEREYLVRLVHKRQLVVGLLSLPWEMSSSTCSNKLAAVICEAHKATKEEAN